jgi:asparagine synthase (glutamine-hydrolysing)
VIYNYESLRSRLKDRGHVFRSKGDCEVVVHAYEEWGVDLAEHLQGQFAFAIWDEEAGRLMLGRDRMGIKPLFVYHDGERLAWASELKGLMQLPDLDAGLRPEAIPSYLAFGYVPTPATFYRNTRALPTASCLILEEGFDPRIQSYWEADFDPRAVPWRQAKREVRRLVRQAVKRRLVADVPLGVLLSGGLDSTIIAAVTASLTQGPLSTFTASFEGSPKYDEAAFARLVSQRLGTLHREVHVGPDCIEQLDTLVDAHDGPFGDSSALPTYAVTQLARENVTVALSGEGSDELFCGYLRFRAMEMASRMPGWAAGLGQKIFSSLPHDPHHRGSKRRMLRFFEAAGLPEEERWLQWVGFFVADLGRVMKPDAGPLPDLTASIRKAMNERSNVLARALSANFGTYLVDDLLVKADRMGMANSMELRVPFLDTDLVEYVAGLPPAHLRRRGTLKYLLRQAFSDVVPRVVLDRGKQGFAVPLPEWFRGPWREVLYERVLTVDAKLWEWLDRDYVIGRAEEHLAGKIDFSQQLWALLTLETWLSKDRA